MLSNCYIEHMETKEQYAALSQFALSVFDVNGLLLQSGDMATRPIGQSSARWQVLGRAGHQPQTVAQMAREIGNSRQAVQRLADVLEKEGLIAFVDNPADKRARLIELTPQGKEVLAEIDLRDKQWSQTLMAELDSEQLHMIAEVLDDIAKILKAHLTSGKNMEKIHEK